MLRVLSVLATAAPDPGYRDLERPARGEVVLMKVKHIDTAQFIRVEQGKGRKFRVDHPFLFLILDQRTGAIPFGGIADKQA